MQHLFDLEIEIQTSLGSVMSLSSIVPMRSIGARVIEWPRIPARSS